MHVYAFGSICRGDISVESDIDLLALVAARDPRFDPDKFSIYSYQRIRELWAAGNAFAWHLALESRIIYSDDGSDFLKELGAPNAYDSAPVDCRRFREMFDSALATLEEGSPSVVFELSTLFLAIRNLATCYSLAKSSTPTFGRHSACKLGSNSVPLSEPVYSILMRARLLSTRGIGEDLGEIDMPSLLSELDGCRTWVGQLCAEVEGNG